MDEVEQEFLLDHASLVDHGKDIEGERYLLSIHVAPKMFANHLIPGVSDGIEKDLISLDQLSSKVQFKVTKPHGFQHINLRAQ